MAHSSTDASTAILALAVPPLTSPGTFRLPTLPSGESPGSFWSVLLAGAGLITQVAFQPKPIDQKKLTEEKLKQESEDNKRVVKMKDVATEIDTVLSESALMKSLLRDLGSLLVGKGLSGSTSWTNTTDMNKQLGDVSMGPLREELKTAIRKHLLQQKNVRQEREIDSRFRVGKLKHKLAPQ